MRRFPRSFALLLALLPLVLVLLASCASHKAPPYRGPQRGVLGAGASMSGRSSDGQRWSLAVVEEDVRFAVNGAVVIFEQAAPAGRLRFQHVEAEGRWVLDLPFGEVRCDGKELVLPASRHDLMEGANYRIDVAGRLVAPKSR
ncbi:MAG: hypothetical protein KDC14_04155 [Planctomycetes bacterium]|nr:hypothetical protein [Planctomycetota bacterium]